jgi:hypothetical protein
VRRADFVRGAAVSAALFAGAACTDGQTAYDGLKEPIQVSGAQFIVGDLPGIPAPDGGSTHLGADAALPLLSIIASPTPSADDIVSGLSGLSFTGTAATTDAVALGVRLGDEGTGYWLVPAAAIDLYNPPPPANARYFPSFSMSFNRMDVPGVDHLRFVAIGNDGSGGNQISVPICIESRVPDNGHTCALFPPRPPVPAVVFALTWDTNFDVDLNVVVPSGLLVSPKTQPTTVVVDGGVSEAGPARNAVGLYDGTTGVIDRDSIGSCIVDGWREEDLVFQDAPPPGRYDIYANPFASCGQPAVRFTLTIYEPGADQNLHPSTKYPPVSGELLASQTTSGAVSATSGAPTGLFVRELKF